MKDMDQMTTLKYLSNRNSDAYIKPILTVISIKPIMSIESYEPLYGQCFKILLIITTSPPISHKYVLRYLKHRL